VPETVDEEASERPRRHPVRTAVLLVILLGLLGGGTWLGWSWTQTQYYVGATPEGFVAVYQGIPGQIAGLHLSRVDHTEKTHLNDLTKVAQDRVKQGISASSLSDAEQKYHELINPANGNTVPTTCPPSGSTAPSSAPPSSPAVSSSPSPAVPPLASASSTSPSPSVSASAVPSTSQSPC
jgi:protein phosphatase